MINFAHGDVFMFGAMTAFFVADGLAGAGFLQANPVIGMLIVLLVSMVSSMIVAVLLERIAYRPLRRAPRLVPLITAIGASLFISNSVRGLYGEQVKAYPQLELFEGRVDLLGVPILKTHLIVIVAAIVIMLFLVWFVGRTRTGRAMRAVSEDKDTAALMGINVDRTIALTFILGGALAGAAGVVQILFNQATVYTLGFRSGLNSFTSAVLGGIGNLSGAVLGGIVLGLINAFSDRYPQPAWTNAIVFAVLIGILVFRPTGLLGQQLADRA
jgi:branched-chain amino acid transport system permease protein